MARRRGASTMKTWSLPFFRFQYLRYRVTTLHRRESAPARLLPPAAARRWPAAREGLLLCLRFRARVVMREMLLRLEHQHASCGSRRVLS